MISKIYSSNQILFVKGSRKGKTKYQIALMVEQKKAKKNRDTEKIKWLRAKIRQERRGSSGGKFNSNGTLNKYRNKRKRRKK